MPWWAWVILAGALGWAELDVPGSYLLWIAFGAALAGATAAIVELPFAEQLGVFAVASALSCAGGYFVYRATHRRRRDTGPARCRMSGVVHCQDQLAVPRIEAAP